MLNFPEFGKNQTVHTLHNITFIIIILLSLEVYCQDKIDLEKTYYDAEFLSIYNKYEEAISLYLMVLENGMNNANIQYKVGLTYLKIPGKKLLAIPYLKEAAQSTSLKYKEELSFHEKKAPVETFLYLGEAYQINNELDKALENYRHYLTLISSISGDTKVINRKIKSCNIALEMRKSPIDIDSKILQFSLPDKVLSNAAFSADGKFVVFNGKRKYYQAIFFSQKIFGEWVKPKNITMEVESDGNFQVSSLSPDGKTLFLVYQNPTDYDLFMSTYSNGRWSKARILNNNINSMHNELHAVLSPVEEALYFVSDKRGSQNGLDIYKSVPDKNGDWGPAENLGPPVNSPFDENTPFFTRDGNVMYFSSNGHNTMGGYDVFISKKADGNSWTKPENLGYPLNTTDDDLYFVPVNNGTIGYISQFNNATGEQRFVYEYVFFTDDFPRYILVDGQLHFPEKKESDIVINDLIINVKDTLGDDVINICPSKQGKFRFKLPAGTYIVNVSGDAIKPQSKTIKIDNDEKTMNFVVEWIEERPEKTTTVNETIHFGFDQYKIGQPSLNELAIVVRVMNTFPSIMLTITGHTDSAGSLWYNQKLSEKRANAAKEIIIESGIHPERISIYGMGERLPVAKNQKEDSSDNPEGRIYNRRVTFSFKGTGSDYINIKKTEIPNGLIIH